MKKPSWFYHCLLLNPCLSRSCAQRFGFRRYVNQRVRDCVKSINWFADLANSVSGSDPTELQHRSIEASRGAVRERAVNGRARLSSLHEAVRALLQGGPGYDTLDFPVGGLALYDATRLSVPAVDSVSLTQLLRSDARDCVIRLFGLMLRSSRPGSNKIRSLGALV